MKRKNKSVLHFMFVCVQNNNLNETLNLSCSAETRPLGALWFTIEHKNISGDKRMWKMLKTSWLKKQSVFPYDSNVRAERRVFK